MTPTITLKPVTGSSLIAEDGWSEDATTLHIKFHNGDTYAYNGLSPAVQCGYEGAPSKGQYFHKNIKGKIARVKI